LENVYIFYGHLHYLGDILDILWPFGTFCIHLVHFFRFWYHVPRKIGQPWFYLLFSEQAGHKLHDGGHRVGLVPQVSQGRQERPLRQLCKHRRNSSITVRAFIAIEMAENPSFIIDRDGDGDGGSSSADG
jgi:hypothetical protein